MALIKCPECGKENVSDSAEACPNCGFGVKEYFKNKTIEKEISNKSIAEEKNNHNNSMLSNKKVWVISSVCIIILLCVVLYGTPLYNFFEKRITHRIL